MKRLLIILFVAICYQLWASTQIEGLYVWNPGKYWWKVKPDKRKNSEYSQIVWDSLLISPDSSYILKGSRFYDVGGKTIEGIIEGTWSNRGDYVSLVPHNVNYSCVPNVMTDSIILINLFEIVPVTRDTIPIKRSLYVCSEDGVVTKYCTDSTGNANIHYSSDIMAIFIEGGFNPNIPFPQMGCHYNIVISESFLIPNINAKVLKRIDNDLWSCFVYKDTLRLGQQFKRCSKDAVDNSAEFCTKETAPEQK